MIDRRTMIGAGGASLICGFALFGSTGGSEARTGAFEVRLSEAEWKKRLTPQQYAVLRGESTARAGSSPLNR